MIETNRHIRQPSARIAAARVRIKRYLRRLGYEIDPSISTHDLVRLKREARKAA